MLPKNKQQLFVYGLIFLLVSGYIGIFGVRQKVDLPLSDLRQEILPINIGDERLNRTTEELLIVYAYGSYPPERFPPLACAGCERGESNKLEIKFPRTLKIGESGIVEVRLTGYNANTYISGSSPESSTKLLISKRSITLTLAGANFSISPGNAITKEKGSMLPLVWAWSVAPNSTGIQELALDISGIPVGMYTKDPKRYINVEVNRVAEGSKIDLATLRTKSLSVTVYTIFGISERLLESIKYAFVVLGFIAMYPAVSEWAKNLFKEKRG